MKSELTKRILVAVIAIPAILGLTWLGGVVFMLLVIAVSLIAQWEFYDLCRKQEVDTHAIAGLLAGIGLQISFYLLNDSGFSGVLTAIFIIVLLRELSRFSPPGGISRVAFTLLGIFYAPFLFGHAILLRELPNLINVPYATGLGFIFLAFIPTWVGDTAAYGFGVKFGKHKFCPPISPKKSIEGTVFGLIFAMLSVVVLHWIYAGYLSLWQAIFLGLAIGVLGQLGDLIESLFKRDVGVKDSSNFLPGHGGILDRFDASLFTIPATYYFLKFVAFF